MRERSFFYLNPRRYALIAVLMDVAMANQKHADCVHQNIRHTFGAAIQWHFVLRDGHAMT